METDKAPDNSGNNDDDDGDNNNGNNDNNDNDDDDDIVQIIARTTSATSATTSSTSSTATIKKRKQVGLSGKKGKTPTKRGKGSRTSDSKHYTIQEKLDIMKEIEESSQTCKVILKHYKEAKSTLCGWRKNRNEYQRTVAEKRGHKKKIVLNDGLKWGKRSYFHICIMYQH